MKTKLTRAALLAGSLLPLAAAQAQTNPTRTDLQRHDLGIRGYETIQARVDFAPGAVAGRHTHPGDEIIYVLEGTLRYEVAGKPITVNKGGVLFIPAGTVHAARNAGATPASELATYVVEKGRPLITPVP